MNKLNLLNLLALGGVLTLYSCSQTRPVEQEEVVLEEDLTMVTVEAESFAQKSEGATISQSGNVQVSEGDWLEFDVEFPVAGRYQLEVVVENAATNGILVMEDYLGNPDGRFYDVSGKIYVSPTDVVQGFSVDGSPFDTTKRKMKLHVNQGNMSLDKVVFTLMRERQVTPVTLTQKMEGDEWELVWADEFDGPEVDTTKWLFDFGNWGWGNNELQYYTNNRQENARIEDGKLVIEARKNDMGQEWTSARLTTRGKQSFLYGKMELKAIVPREKGNWAAGWTLGDSYVDEIDWPYCGEIDIMESVGYEVNNETGDGIAHCTVHTPAYYFKIDNQISSVIDVIDIADEYHTYSVVWTPNEIRGYIDGEEYYLYDKTADEKEWPFNEAQNLILNLAMGGGWGGAQGMDTTVVSQKLMFDYVRVYGKK